MKRLNINLLLRTVYLIALVLILITIIISPKLISGSIHFTEEIIVEEEFVEGFVIAILLGLSLLIQRYYKREVDLHKKQLEKINNDKKQTEEKLNDAFSYIGKVNVQIQEIKSIFNKDFKYPKTKTELKKTLHYFSERALGIVNVDWVLIRIIDSVNQKTISEHLKTRGDVTLQEYPHISNKTIIEGQSDSSSTVITSHPENMNIISCCIFPGNNISNEQRNLIEAIVSQIIMLFIIFESTFYKKSNT